MDSLFALRMDRSEIDESEFSPTELAILDKLGEGRATPAYLAEELDREQPYIRNLLGDLVRLGLVGKVHRGLYELGDGEQKDGGEGEAVEDGGENGTVSETSGKWHEDPETMLDEEAPDS